MYILSAIYFFIIIYGWMNNEILPKVSEKIESIKEPTELILESNPVEIELFFFNN